MDMNRIEALSKELGGDIIFIPYKSNEVVEEVIAPMLDDDEVCTEDKITDEQMKENHICNEEKVIILENEKKELEEENRRLQFRITKLEGKIDRLLEL